MCPPKGCHEIPDNLFDCCASAQINEAEESNLGKRRHDEASPLSSSKKGRIVTGAGFCYLRRLGGPVGSSNWFSFSNLICLRSDTLYTLGRGKKYCDIVFDDRRVSKRHCQIFLDGYEQKIVVRDGSSLPSSLGLDEIRKKFRLKDPLVPSGKTSKVRASLNGIFVNERRVKKSSAQEVFVGDEITFVHGIKVGFVVERLIFTEEKEGKSGNIQRQWIDEAKSPWVVTSAFDMLSPSEVKKSLAAVYKNPIGRALFLLNSCRCILESMDPVNYMRLHEKFNNKGVTVTEDGLFLLGKDGCQRLLRHKINKIPAFGSLTKEIGILDRDVLLAARSTVNRNIGEGKIIHPTENNFSYRRGFEGNTQGMKKATELIALEKPLVDGPCALQGQGCSHKYFSKENLTSSSSVECINNSSSGKTFSLNRLEFMNCGSLPLYSTVTLPELLHPMKSISRLFIATFTSDILWFLSYCEVPNFLPVTVACHNTERCWSTDPDKRMLSPYRDYPNLVVVYPPFPDVIAFGREQKRQGVACHHPKLLVLQMDDCIRVIVTSANLVSKQWNNVTNTVWWQDFPRHIAPNYSSIFAPVPCTEATEGSTKADFATQLAGFMASLLVDLPNQAHWIIELTKYDFSGASVHLVPSIPGLHSQMVPYPSDVLHHLSVKQIIHSISGTTNFLGSVQASVVGLSHRFRCSADSNGANLRALAALLGKCKENVYGMSAVVLKRITNLSIDPNAVSVFVCDLDECFEGACLQLGFLPKNVAKWVAPLSDVGFFSFAASIYPKEALASALEGSSSKVQLILYVSQGPNFSEMARLIQPEHASPLCSLLSSMQRSVGLWRLEEVLSQYKWPESQEIDFLYSSSSIGTSINAQFLADFAAASGKRSCKFSESQESDPEWGRWRTSQEQRRPSIKIIYPTMERVKNSFHGIEASRQLLCLPERTWQRLKTMNIFHDAIPHPSERKGYPMHIKVACRRFLAKHSSSSFGWIYCGSHNFSPAAWGHQSVLPVKRFVPRNAAALKLDSRLRVCNYELGVLFVIPPPDKSNSDQKTNLSLDNIVLPFVVPAPEYRPNDSAATPQSMRKALAEFIKKETPASFMNDVIDEEIPVEEEEILEITDCVVEEKEEEKAYAETLWSQPE